MDPPLSLNLKPGVMVLLKWWREARDRGGGRRGEKRGWRAGSVSFMPGGRCLKENLYSLDSARDVHAFSCVFVDIHVCFSVFVCEYACLPELKVWLVHRGRDHRASFLNCC